MEIFKAHSRASDLSFREIQTPECSTLLTALPLLLKSRLGSVRIPLGVGTTPATEGVHFTLSPDGSLLTKLTPKTAADHMSCAVPLDVARRTGMKYLRIKFDNSEYNYVAGGTSTVYQHRLAANVWHEVRLDYSSPTRTIIKLGSYVLYDGPNKNSINIYFNAMTTKVWLDTAREGTALGTYGGVLPAGYEWY